MSDVTHEVEVLAPLPEAESAVSPTKKALPWLKGHQFSKEKQPAKAKQLENVNRLRKGLTKELTPATATRLAQTLIREALDGNMKAMEMVWDRVEGKAVQVNENRGSGELTIRIERVG